MAIISSNAESIRSPELVPSRVRENSATFITLVEEYYKFLNSNNASDALSSITSNRNIDTVSSDYLTLIASEIAKSFPVRLNTQDLYRKIVQYYRIKGTEDSIVVFFKLFFDEIVEVYYPKVDILRVSDGKWDATKDNWTNTDGFISADKYIQDSEFYQEFSYLIRTAADFTSWNLPFQKLAHPAGLKFFSEVVIYLSIQGQFESWLNTRLTANVWEDTIITNFHSPVLQPGWLDNAARLISLLLQGNTFFTEAAIDSILISIIQYVSANDSWYLEMLHNTYDSNIKFSDPVQIGNYANIVPWSGGVYRPYDVNGFNFNNVSSVITVA